MPVVAPLLVQYIGTELVSLSDIGPMLLAQAVLCVQTLAVQQHKYLVHLLELQCGAEAWHAHTKVPAGWACCVCMRNANRLVKFFSLFFFMFLYV